MPPEIQPEESQSNVFTPLTKVTPVSKYLALGLFIILPVAALYVGMQFAPVEYVEVEKVVYRDAPSVEQSPVASDAINPEALAQPSPAGNVALRSVTLPVASGYYGPPVSEVYVGSTFAFKASGECNFAPHDREDLFSNRPMLKAFIPSIEMIAESGVCWSAGGSELYRVVDGDTVRIVGLVVSECGNLPESECSSFGTPQVLYEIDSAGVVTKQYTGGVFGG